MGWAQLGTKGAQTGTASCDLGDPQCADWTSTDGAKGRGHVGSRFLVLCDRSELENRCANGAGTDFDYAALIKIYSLVGRYAERTIIILTLRQYFQDKLRHLSLICTNHLQGICDKQPDDFSS